MSVPAPLSALRRTLLLLLLAGFGLLLYVALIEVVGAVTVHDWQADFFGRSGFLLLNIWLPWCLMGPVLVWWMRRHPIRPPRWGRDVLHYIGIFLLTSFVHLAAIAFRYHYAIAPHKPEMASYAGWQHMGHFLIGDAVLLFDAILFTVFVASFNLARFFAELQGQTLQAERLQASLQQAQLQTLQMQVNPHFLFNTLNAISVLVRKQDCAQAVTMLHRLAGFFRRSLDSGARPLVPLAEELDSLNDYLALESLRFADRLHITQHHEPAALGAAIPPLLLQPLVENALRHGLSNRESGGHLHLDSHCDAGQLVLRITDDGEGCDFSSAAIQSRRRDGIGLNNVQDRLRLHFADRASLHTEGRPGAGVTITLRLPISPATHMQPEPA